jgi:REP element-mobilizing transposase RayT
MANTYASLLYHLVFSTKNREPLISLGIEQRVWSYIGGIARKHQMSALQVGGIEDHVHALILAPPTLSVSQIAQLVKGESSKWIHEEFHALRDFRWQDGYGAFTVNKQSIDRVMSYIKNQREHHRRLSFQEEYLRFLQKSGIKFDERFLWG